MAGGAQVGGGDARSGERSRVGIALGVVGLILHCTLIAFFDFFSAALVAPRYGQLLLFIAWSGLLALGVRWLRSPRPGLALATPFLAAGAWIAISILGDGVLGWAP